MKDIKNNKLTNTDRRTLITAETQHIRDSYPSIEILESGDIASWLQERCDQLMVKAEFERNSTDSMKLFCGGVSVISLGMLAASPIIPLTAAISAIGYVVALIADIKQTHQFRPIPFSRENPIDFITRIGNATARAVQTEQQDEYLSLLQYLSPFERSEADMLNCHLHILTSYLHQLPIGKRFYAYRWLLQMYTLSKGFMPEQAQLHEHITQVSIDSRIDMDIVKEVSHLNYIQEQKAAQSNLMSTGTRDTNIVGTKPNNVSRSLASSNSSSSNLASNSRQSSSSSDNFQLENVDFRQISKLPLPERCDRVIDILEATGLHIEKICNSQIIAVCGNQRGGKSTLLGLVSILMLASTPDSELYYFSTGRDIYPVRTKKHISALTFENDDKANLKASKAIYKFFRDLDAKPVNSLANTIIMVDEVAGILKNLAEHEVSWLLEFWLRAFAKTGATLYLALHATNIMALAGKNSGWAKQFKDGISWIGCKAEAVEGGSRLRPVLRATGSYFSTNPEDFNSVLEDLGTIPDWLKLVPNPDTGQPDPIRTLLKLFPEFYQPIEELTAIAPQDTSTYLMKDFLNDTGVDEDDTEDEDEDEDIEADIVKILLKIKQNQGLTMRGVSQSKPFGRNQEKNKYEYIEPLILKMLDQKLITEKDGKYYL